MTKEEFEELQLEFPFVDDVEEMTTAHMVIKLQQDFLQGCISPAEAIERARNL